MPLQTDGKINDTIVYSCNATTEMHFERIEEQFQHALKKYYGSEINDSTDVGSSSNKNDDEDGRRKDIDKVSHAYFDAGEVLVTRHSNLNNIHVIFHIVPIDMEVIYDKKNERFKKVQ